MLTDGIAKIIVKNADEKEFIGKNSVKAKDLTTIKS
jgi:methyl-accepting chemotaxis protein